MYAINYYILVEEPLEIAQELGLRVIAHNCDYDVLFETEADLIAFRDLVEELYDV